MASPSTAATPKAVARPAGRYTVYVAAVPLRAPQGPAQALMLAGYSLGLWDLQHFMVLLRPDPARTQVLFFKIFMALAVCSGSSAGIVGLRFPASRPRGCSCRVLGAVAEQITRSGSEKNAAEDPGKEELVRRALRRRRSGRRREVQRAVAHRPGRRGARLPRLHQRARRSVDRRKTCPGFAQISRQ